MNEYFLGIDVGSTTVKTYLTNQENKCLYKVMFDIIQMSDKQF